MVSLKTLGYCLCFVFAAVLLQGCDDYDAPTAPTTTATHLASPLDKPKYVENFIVKNPHRASVGDTVETNVSCDPLKRIPLTVRLEAFSVDAVGNDVHLVQRVVTGGVVVAPGLRVADDEIGEAGEEAVQAEAQPAENAPEVRVRL